LIVISITLFKFFFSVIVLEMGYFILISGTGSNQGSPHGSPQGSPQGGPQGNPQGNPQNISTATLPRNPNISETRFWALISAYEKVTGRSHMRNNYFIGPRIAASNMAAYVAEDPGHNLSRVEAKQTAKAINQYIRDREFCFVRGTRIEDGNTYTPSGRLARNGEIIYLNNERNYEALGYNDIGLVKMTRMALLTKITGSRDLAADIVYGPGSGSASASGSASPSPSASASGSASDND